MPTADQPIILSKFFALCRTTRIETARGIARAHANVVGFCPFDGLFYVVTEDEFRRGPFVKNGTLPIPKARSE